MAASSNQHSSRLAIKILFLLFIVSLPPTIESKLESGFTRSAHPQLSPCATAIAAGAVCEAANQRAVELMNAGQFEAFTVVQDVRTGALVVFAASQPAKLDVTTPVLPLSVSKLLLAASWWDHAQPDTRFDSYRGLADTRKLSERLISIDEMLVGGSDNAGRLAATALRKSVGTEAVLDDFKRYGFGSGPDARFWKEVSPRFQTRLTPVSDSASLSSETSDEAWANTLSLGETNLKFTGLHITRFLQAIGNGGVMLPPIARGQSTSGNATREDSRKDGIRVMRRETAQRLQAGMRDAVKRGTARSIANSLAESGWSLGGKTGTGPGPAPIGPQSDGWFAGLIFDAHGRARFTVATFVRHGGTGGGNAARISAELARYIIGKGD